MGRKLARTVYVTGASGEQVRFSPGDDVPAWAEKAITNPKAWEGDADGEQPEQATDDDQMAKYREWDGTIPSASQEDDTSNQDAERDYAAMTVLELRALIRTRNEGRDEADRVSGDGNKADLIAALEADDES